MAILLANSSRVLVN